MDSNSNFAYIDGANLHKAVKKFSWELDYFRFRIWLKEKYNVAEAYIFIGKISKNKELYSYLERCGYTLVFKDVTYKNGLLKGNCDADLIVKAMEDFIENKFKKAVIVSSDGDFVPLIKFLMKKESIEVLLSPSEVSKCSVLIKRTDVKIAYVLDQQEILQKEKAPDEDGTSQGSFS